jgi:hypothetical protein
MLHDEPLSIGVAQLRAACRHSSTPDERVGDVAVP